MSDAKFRLKVVINKQKTKVLFAEIDSDFADVLLSFLTMPLGSIVRVMNKHYGDNAPVLGSLTTLYKGVSDLDSVFFSSEGGKEMLLNPRSWFNNDYRELKLSLSEPQPAKYFTCEGGHYDSPDNVGIYYGTARCSCGKVLSRQINFPEYPESANCSDDGLLTSKTASFIICDDMRIAHVMVSFMETCNTLGITDTKDTELMNVTLGLNEIMDLLKGMLTSSTPLTDVILNNKQKETLKIEHVKIENVAASNCKNMMNVMIEESASSCKKMILNLIVQKSTNKLLFAQAEEDFVDFLFSLLTIPLGGVESLLGSNTCLKSIDNFYTTLTSMNVDNYFKAKDTKFRLLNPKLPNGYVSKDQILPLTEEQAPLMYFSRSASKGACFSSRWSYSFDNSCSFKSPKGDLYYVKGQRMYMVSDDLTVTPLFMSSSIFHLNRLNIPMSDVEELKFDIGLEEALRILKASLTSTSALTNALLLSKKSVKQEQ